MRVAATAEWPKSYA